MHEQREVGHKLLETRALLAEASTKLREARARLEEDGDEARADEDAAKLLVTSYSAVASMLEWVLNVPSGARLELDEEEQPTLIKTVGVEDVGRRGYALLAFPAHLDGPLSRGAWSVIVPTPHLTQLRRALDEFDRRQAQAARPVVVATTAERGG